MSRRTWLRAGPRVSRRARTEAMSLARSGSRSTAAQQGFDVCAFASPDRIDVSYDLASPDDRKAFALCFHRVEDV